MVGTLVEPSSDLVNIDILPHHTGERCSGSSPRRQLSLLSNAERRESLQRAALPVCGVRLYTFCIRSQSDNVCADIHTTDDQFHVLADMLRICLNSLHCPIVLRSFNKKRLYGNISTSFTTSASGRGLRPSHTITLSLRAAQTQWSPIQVSMTLEVEVSDHLRPIVQFHWQQVRKLAGQAFLRTPRLAWIKRPTGRCLESDVSP